MTIRLAIAFAILSALFSPPTRADDILFIGNSFTFGATVPVVQSNGGVPKLVEAIAQAKGKQVATTALTAGGKDWSYHLSQPATNEALQSKTWTSVVLQDMSTRPTRFGNVDQFLQDGEIFSDRISQNSPAAGVVLFETWARPPGEFYRNSPTYGPKQMMGELHDAYALLRKNLAAKNPSRPALVAPVGTAFARAAAEYPEVNVNASDQHHATADGYYLAALVIYETIYRDRVKGAPTHFYHDALVIPDSDATKLQAVADEVSASAAN